MTKINHNSDDKKNTKFEFATFAAGCFWGVQDYFDGIEGVIETFAGYTGGYFIKPTYEDVCTGKTGHSESVQIKFDSDKISFEQLVYAFFKIHDPTTLNRQGPDIGSQYRSAIFYHSEKQKEISLKVINELENKRIFKNKIVTELANASQFYKAEDYHQHYFKKTGISSCHKLYEF
jgi:peptide-methionine (S)-S-oxide reductase